VPTARTIANGSSMTGTSYSGALIVNMSLSKKIAKLQRHTRWSDNNAIVLKQSDVPKQTIAARPRFTEKSKFATPGAKPIDHFSDQIPFDLKLRR
jgi:hypothetical protein